jgi:hypothetical protein
MDHDEAQAQLPTYVAAEARGVNVAQRFPQLTRHLHHCDECAALYVELLELERKPPVIAHVPPLDMAVIKQARRRRVIEATREILGTILPKQLPRLQPVADAFFLKLEQLEDQFSLREAPQMALAAGAGEGTLALRFLAATFVATQELDAQLTPEKVKTLAAEGRLSSVIHQAATSAAQQMKLGRHTNRFAAEYERWLMAQLSTSDQSATE